jgi:hypothetical protein
MTQVRPCRHAKPVLRREERNAAPEFVREPRRGLPRSSEPSSLVRPFGSWEVLCISSTLDEINSPHCHEGPTSAKNRGSPTVLVPNLRPSVIVAQCSIGVKMPTAKICSSCTRAGRVCNRSREAYSDSCGRAPNRPSVEVGRHWDASPQDVPGRPRRRALTTVPRMLNRVVFVKSLEVVLFSCFSLTTPASP